MSAREALLREVAAAVPVDAGHPVRVGIDGITGAGKTTFRGELAEVLRGLGREVVEASGDDFHHVSAHRWAQGRQSARGYFEDAYDYGAMAAKLLKPLGPGGSREVRLRHHDLAMDEILCDEPVTRVAADAVLVVDGSFLLRPEVAELWDLVVHLDAPVAVSALRQVDRDGAPADPDDPYHRRYFGGYDVYVQDCDARARADIVIDNSDLVAPRVVRHGR